MSSADHFTKEETERVIRGEFKGINDAMELMQKRKPGRQLVGRWDWHLWMFLISTCLPCFGVYCLAMYVRSGLWAEYHQKQEEEEAKKQQQTIKPMDPMQQRMLELEKELKYLRNLVVLGGTKLPPETIMRLLTPAQATKQQQDSVSDQRSDLVVKSWSDRVWNRVKKWLPFYVEPFFPKNSNDPYSGLSTIFKSEK
eukprot:g716.t1